MTIFFSPIAKAAESTLHRLLAAEIVRSVIEDSSYLINLEEKHWFAVIEIHYNTAENPWSAHHLHMLLIMRRDGSNIQQAEVISLSRIRKTSPALVRISVCWRRESGGKLHRALSLDYEIKLMHVRIRDIRNYTVIWISTIHDGSDLGDIYSLPSCK